MTNKSATKSEHIIAQSAFVCGEAFQRSAENLIMEIWKIDEQPTNDMPKEIADVVVCATNLTFAIELYLKALLSHLELQVPKAHDLFSLYKTIPQPIRIIVEEVYESGCLEDKSNLPSYSFTIALGQNGGIPEWNDGIKKSPCLPDLLERSKDLFQSWRYVCEINEHKNDFFQYHKFEYGLLRFAAEAIRVEVAVRLSGMDETQKTNPGASDS